MVSSLHTLPLEKASVKLGGPTRGLVDQQQVTFLNLGEGLSPHSERGFRVSEFGDMSSVASIS